MSDDINQQILQELRQVKSIGRRVFWMLLLLLILTVLAFPVRHSRTASTGISWEAVTTPMRQEEFPKALAMAQALVAQQPNYYWGHEYLGSIYLAMDDVTNAQVHYLRAYELFPNEESGKNLAAIHTRLARAAQPTLLSE